MRVKRLEIQGFKSFKDKTVIHFDQGITGIVGPNGCGKSNIVDAFFWVMGEQSYKHMRGNGSDDLIFNGSSKYSPLGMAEATLVMETDVPDSMDSGPASGPNAPAGASAQELPIHLRAKEVAVTRRVYRSGEGEYFINGVPARLKDIHELFMDTGVGAKGYSVIEQGQIGKIVNSKPEERRLLVEEAAGIAKYKARKKESLRKMEATQANLSRLTDVLQEIERSLGSLERQAQKARLHKKYRAELSEKEITWGRRKALVFKQKLEALHKTREAVEQELVGMRAELQIAENAIENDRISQLGDTKVAEELQARVQQLSGELAREQSALDLSRKRQGDLETQLANLAKEKQEVEAAISNEKEKIAACEVESMQADETFRMAAEEARHKDEQVRELRQAAEQARRGLDDTKRRLMQGISQASELNSKGASLASRIDSARALSERLVQQIETLQEKFESSCQENEKIQQTAQELKARRDELREERKLQSAQIQTKDQELKQADRNREQSHRELTQLRSRLQSLQELAAAHEGFGDGPKAALDWAKAKGKKNLGALADVLDVKPGYESALEGWLENRLENLITEDPDTALEALRNLREGKQGRAAIQIATSVHESGSAADQGAIRDVIKSAGCEVVGELSDFVKVNSKLGESSKTSAGRFLASVFVVDSLNPLVSWIAGNGISRLNGWSVVSLDGTALDSSGVVRGGSTESNNTASVLGRKRAIAELETQVAEADAKHQECERIAAEAKQTLELMRARLQTLDSDLQNLEIENAAIERDIVQMTRAKKELENQLNYTTTEKEEVERELEDARSQRLLIEDQLNQIISSRSELEQAIAEGEGEVSAREAALRNEEDDLQARRISEASIRERSSSLKRELQSNRAMLADRERRLADIIRVLEHASKEQAQYSGGDSTLESRIIELTTQLAAAQDRLSQLKDRLEQTSQKLNDGLERIKELHKLGDQKNNDSMQLALDSEKLQGELNHLIQNLEEKYGLNCLDQPTPPIQEEMKEPVVTAEMTAEEEQALGEEVERLRERLRRLGEVNTMAIEEYEELKKRYDYLLGEKADLERSIENLQDAIEYINKTSEERFKKAFEAISNRFERLFPIIFGGGQARLSLIYPEGSNDILEAGVDIMAQPPGKKVANITLLSGGEKALTAVSLIFAIFMVKPSPFCLLDEVDAPLDDANIGKFNALMREMSAKSQFILITHNKKTMELNNTLYGVTMEEPGVSKVVSVQLH